MEIDLKSDLKTNRLILTVIPTQEYAESVAGMVRDLNASYNRVIYVSLNKLINPLRRELQDRSVDLGKFFFVDGVTKTAIPNPPEMQNCIYVPSPDDMTKLSIAITKVLQTFDPDCLFFESLSTLLIYEDPMIVTQFVHSLINKVNAYGIRAVFTCLDGEKERELIRALALTMDKVIEPPK